MIRFLGQLDRDLVISYLFPVGFALVIAKLVAIAKPNSPFWGITAIISLVGIACVWAFLRAADRRGTEMGREVRRRYERVVALSMSEAARQAASLLADETCFKRTPASASSTPLPGGIPNTVRGLLESTERIEGVDVVNLIIDRQAVEFRNSFELQVGAWTSVEGESWSITVNVETGKAQLYSDEDPDLDFPSIFHLIVMEGGE
jgi:hypothetical protein